MAALLPTNTPAPMIPPMEIIVRWRARSDFDRRAVAGSVTELAFAFKLFVPGPDCVAPHDISNRYALQKACLRWRWRTRVVVRRGRSARIHTPRQSLCAGRAARCLFFRLARQSRHRNTHSHHPVFKGEISVC
jgi:hypothetical protein